jgi:hypothetical protein
MAICGRLKMELVGWITAVFWDIDLGAVNAVVKGKLNQGENLVRHTEWEGRKGKQSPNGNVSEISICQVKDLYDTVWPPGEYCGPKLVSKIGPGLLGMPILWPRVVSVRDTVERKNLSSWAFLIVEGCNEGQFLPVAAGRTEAVMVMTKVVVVVGCFAASTACFLLKF